MSLDDIRAYRNAQPFTPFEIVFHDGRSISVRVPERIAIAPWGKIGVYVQSLPHFFAASEIATLRAAPSATAGDTQ